MPPKQKISYQAHQPDFIKNMIQGSKIERIEKLEPVRLDESPAIMESPHIDHIDHINVIEESKIPPQKESKIAFLNDIKAKKGITKKESLSSITKKEMKKKISNCTKGVQNKNLLSFNDDE